MKQLLPLFLIAVVLGCPIWCPAGACGNPTTSPDAKQDCGHCCPHCAHKKPSETSNHNPACPSDDQSPGPSQCFCSGAVLGTVDDEPVVAETEFTLLAALILVNAGACRLSRAAPFELERRHPTLSGRDIRCLFMSFL